MVTSGLLLRRLQEKLSRATIRKGFSFVPAADNLDTLPWDMSDVSVPRLQARPYCHHLSYECAKLLKKSWGGGGEGGMVWELGGLGGWEALGGLGQALGGFGRGPGRL